MMGTAANISTTYNNHIVIVSYMGTILYPIFLSLIMFMCVTRWVGGGNIRRIALYLFIFCLVFSVIFGGLTLFLFLRDAISCS